MVLSFAQAELIGLIVHSCLFGIYLILFFSSLPFDMDDHFRIKLKRYNTVLLTSNLLLFMLISAHWVVQIIRSQRAFIDTAGEPGDPASVYYSFPADYMNLLKESLYLMQTFIGDCTMIYRLWIVYNKKVYVISFPVVIITAYATSAIAVVIALGKTTLGENIFISSAGSWAITVFVTTVALNVIITSLISYRIWSVQHQVKGIVQGGGLMSVVHIIIESAALYTTTALLTLIGYSTEQLWQFITIDMISPIIGISFTLISVRVSRGTPSQGGYNSAYEAPSSNVVRIRGVESRREAIGLETISVNVTQHVTKHSDLEDGLGSGGEAGGDDSTDQKLHL